MFLLWVSVVSVVLPGISITSLICARAAVSLDEDVDTNQELVGHGISNLAAGFLGTVYVLPIMICYETLTVDKTELSRLCQYALVSRFPPYLTLVY